MNLDHAFYLSSQNQLEKDKNSVNISNFVSLSLLGKGSFADVYLVKKKDTNKIYALKVLKKKMLEKRRQVNHVHVERKIMVENL